MNRSKALCTAITMGAALLLPIAASAAASVDLSARSNGERVEMSVDTEVLSSDDGAAQIYASMKKRAAAACKREIPRKTGKKTRVEPCMKKLVKGFVKDLDDERVSALHASKS